MPTTSLAFGLDSNWSLATGNRHCLPVADPGVKRAQSAAGRDERVLSLLLDMAEGSSQEVALEDSGFGLR
jgi:hypothetical protein